MFSSASVAVSGLMLCAPMFEDTAAPEAAIAVARSKPMATCSTSAVLAYSVDLLPTNSGLNTKKSALRPRRFAVFESFTLSAALIK